MNLLATTDIPLLCSEYIFISLFCRNGFIGCKIHCQNSLMQNSLPLSTYILLVCD